VRLLVTTPTTVILDAPGVVHVRAEDETGAFGILDRHADFVTVLVPSVLSWRDAKGTEGHVAVRGGVLNVSGGDEVKVASRDAVSGDDLETLERNVVTAYREQEERERQARRAETRLQLAAIHRVRQYLQPGEARSGGGG
jgi:F-type H+-transporting ATPase subunit epsilon